NVKDNGDKNFWDVDDDGCPDLNIEIEDDEGNTIQINGDKNEDGIPDYNIDKDGDGVPDLNIDTDGDGKPDLNLVILKDWKPSQCITLGDIQFSSGINAKAEINIDLDNDDIPEINIDTNGDFKADFNISLDGETPILNIGKVPDEWKPETDYTHQKFSYDTMNELEPLLNIDTNGDGCADTNIDLDGDDIPDLNIDIDKDGIPDVNIDGDGDGKADLNLDRDDDGIAEENIVEITAWNPDTKIGQICTMIYNPDKEEEESKDEDKSNGEVLGSYYPGDHIGGALTGDTSHLMYHAGIIFLSMGMLSFLFFLNSHTDHNQ
ncbi:MAG: hypothetical protein HFE67_06995, partial [Erysipelotrichaceae bacterium]|nr:hypothetical protein [Erysipelotrichaceae bacterium]